MGRGRDHWRRWHGNRFATAHLKKNISWSVYLRKYFWHLLIWVRWYLSSYAHCSSERISLMLQMGQSSFFLTFAHIKRYLDIFDHLLMWGNIFDDAKCLCHHFSCFCNQVKQNIITKLAFEVLGLEEGDMGEADYHPLPHHHHNNSLIHNHHHTGCLKKVSNRMLLEPQCTRSISGSRFPLLFAISTKSFS